MVVIAVGPAGFGLVAAHDQIDLLARISVTVLLFVVGLKLDLNHIRHIGAVALGLTTLVGLVTITVSTYMILNSQPLYARLARGWACSSTSGRFANWRWSASGKETTRWKPWCLAWGATQAGC